jgi:GNAT superfamily N-acetyltransferase
MPKLLMTGYMGYSVIGLRDESANKLIGFVDLSLQPNTGTLDALKPRPLHERQKIYGDKNLAPYLCNLLVSPDYRKKGLGLKLISACEDLAKSWGHSAINLHVETKSTPALSLYIKSNFMPVKSIQPLNGVLFMRNEFQQQQS